MFKKTSTSDKSKAKEVIPIDILLHIFFEKVGGHGDKER